MKNNIKDSLRWNHIYRKFYVGLYNELGKPCYLQMYYSHLHMSISMRGV